MDFGQQAWQQSYPPNPPWGTYRGAPRSGDSFPGALTYEERMEAKRLAEEANFRIALYQVVRREYIAHRFDPAMTVRYNSITFNNSCISKLEDATYIQFLISPEEKKLAIRPCGEGARDAVRWCVVRGADRRSREITCKPFTKKLYRLMNWKEDCRYKLQGMQITYLEEKLYLFDLSSREEFPPAVRDPETGKLRRPEPSLPAEWLESFGLSVPEHEASIQINLSDDSLPAENSVKETPNHEPAQITDGDGR